jgi:predicted DNA binding protein
MARIEEKVRAAHTGQAQFCEHVRSRSPAAWTATAAKHGYRSCAAVLLVHNDISYGVLAVYHEQPDRFDETERQLLTKLAETVAFALHSLETEQALTADRTVSAKLQIADRRYYLFDLAGDGVFIDCDVVRVRGTVPHEGDSCIQYLTVDGHAASSVRESLQSHPDVAEVVTIDDEERGRFQVHVTGPVPELSLASQAVVAYSTTIGVDGATITIELPDRESISSTVEALAETFEHVSALAVTESDQTGEGRPPIGLDVANLTDKQAQALQAAYYHGYFERPRGNTATAIADSLGVSHATFLQHLHRAQQKVFQQLLSDR